MASDAHKEENNLSDTAAIEKQCELNIGVTRWVDYKTILQHEKKKLEQELALAMIDAHGSKIIVIEINNPRYSTFLMRELLDQYAMQFAFVQIYKRSGTDRAFHMGPILQTEVSLKDFPQLIDGCFEILKDLNTEIKWNYSKNLWYEVGRNDTVYQERAVVPLEESGRRVRPFPAVHPFYSIEGPNGLFFHASIEREKFCRGPSEAPKSTVMVDGKRYLSFLPSHGYLTVDQIKSKALIEYLYKYKGIIHVRSVDTWERRHAENVSNIDPILHFAEFRMYANLMEIITVGLGLGLGLGSGLGMDSGQPDNTWTTFLTKGIYDPRLFIFIFTFLDTSEAEYKVELEQYLQFEEQYPPSHNESRRPKPKKSCINRILFNRLVWQST